MSSAPVTTEAEPASGGVPPLVRIPFNRPQRVGPELAYIAEAIELGNASGDGPFSERCCRMLEDRFGIGKVLLTGSCTAALEIAALLCDFAPGDEVVMPSFTYVATASAFVRAGARPVFADIRPDTLCLDMTAVEAALTPRTRAIVPVHYGGVACDMTTLGAIAGAHGLRVVEDAAQGVGATYRGRALGTIGDLGCYSFHETKNVQCGQGGALCLNREADATRAEILRDRGTNRGQHFRGEIDRYTWMDVGSAFLMSEILAAYLCAQLEEFDAIAAARARVHGWYREALAALEARGCLRLPVIPPDCEINHHVCAVILPDEATRDALMAFLHDRSIYAVMHYMPLHTSPYGRKLGPPPSLPVTDTVSACLLRLPLYNDLAESDVARVVESIEHFFARR